MNNSCDLTLVQQIIQCFLILDLESLRASSSFCQECEVLPLPMYSLANAGDDRHLSDIRLSETLSGVLHIAPEHSYL